MSLILPFLYPDDATLEVHANNLEFIDDLADSIEYATTSFLNRYGIPAADISSIVNSTVPETAAIPLVLFNQQN